MLPFIVIQIKSQWNSLFPLIIMCSLILFGMCVNLSFSPSFIYSVSRVIGTVKIWVSFKNANNWCKLETLEAPEKQEWRSKDSGHA